MTRTLALAVAIAPDIQLLRNIRAPLRELGRARGFPDSFLDELLLVAVELTTNAVEATSPDQGGPVALRVYIDGDSVVLEVENPLADDARAPRVGNEPPEAHVPRGRGLVVAERLSDELEIERRRDHVLARCTKRLPPVSPDTAPDTSRARTNPTE